MYISKLRHGTKCDECDGQKPNFLPLLARMLKNEVILTSKTCQFCLHALIHVSAQIGSCSVNDLMLSRNDMLPLIFPFV